MALTRINFGQINTTTKEALFVDPTILLNSAQTGTNDKDSGVIIERGSDTNVGLIWDQSAGTFAAITTTDTGAVRGNITVSAYADFKANNVIVDGNLTVNGTTTTVNSTNVSVDDLNLTLASGAASAAAANGAGISIDGANATFTYVSSGDKWQTNKPLGVTGNITSTGTVTISDADNQFVQGDTGYITKQYVLYGTTTTATETEIFVGGTSSSRIPVPTNTTIFYDVMIAARRTDVTGESAGWNLKAVVDNFSGVVADVGTVYEVAVARDDANWEVDSRADDTNNSINIYVTGAAGKTVKWVAVVQTREVTT